jgi:hypothetical protein
MTELLSVTTKTTAIAGVLTSAGKYLSNLAANQIDQSGPEVTALEFVLSGVKYSFLTVKVQPFRGQFSAVQPMTRSALVSWQSGNESHAQKLIASVRSAMTDRNPIAADKAIRSLGAEGFSTNVVGV